VLALAGAAQAGWRRGGIGVRILGPPILLACLLFVAAGGASATGRRLEVVVTNDDGVSAPGIDALVEALAANPRLDVRVVAPALNSSGTGENRTTTQIGVSSGTTASGFPATVVDGFPGDAALFGVLQSPSGDPPDLVVSGINFGQNLSAEVLPLSGTVGAASWAARHGVPAFAVSAGLGLAPNYAEAARFTADLVELFRRSHGFRRKMREADAPFRGLVLNVNVPTCLAGSVRGVRVVPVGRLTVFTGYTLLSEAGGLQTWAPTVASSDFFTSDCTSTVRKVASDVEAFTNGFVTVSPLDPERNASGRRVKDFAFVARLFWEARPHR
jgi:5'-nucleotidase